LRAFMRFQTLLRPWLLIEGGRMAQRRALPSFAAHSPASLPVCLLSRRAPSVRLSRVTARAALVSPAPRRRPVSVAP
jgi:hypothetical protein